MMGERGGVMASPWEWGAPYYDGGSGAAAAPPTSTCRGCGTSASAAGMNLWNHNTAAAQQLAGEAKDVVGVGPDGCGVGSACRLRALLRSPIVRLFLQEGNEDGNYNALHQSLAAPLETPVLTFEGFLQRQGYRRAADAAAGQGEPRAKRRRGQDGAAAAEEDGSDDEPIVVRVSTQEERAAAARANAVDLSSSTPGRAAAAPNNGAASRGQEPPPAVTEAMLAEKIGQLSRSKNYETMSINQIRAKLAQIFGQDLARHRKAIKRLVKLSAGVA